MHRKARKMLRTIFTSTISAALLVSMTYAQSTTDTATSNVTVSITNNVAISDFDDIVLTEYADYPGNFGGTDNFCISATIGTASATLTGSGSGGALEVANTVSGDIVPLDAFFYDSSGAQTAITAGVPIASVQVPIVCNPGDGMFVLELGFNIGQFDTPPSAGDYAGTVTLLVSGE